MINAICSGCGAEKSAAIKLCNNCGALPTTEDDRKISVCLSKDCLRQDNLRIASLYIRKNKRLPGFHDKVLRKAEKIVSEMPEDFQLSQSFVLDKILFEESQVAVLDD